MKSCNYFGKNGKEHHWSVKWVSHQDRTVDGIKQKMAALNRRKMHSDDPLMSQEVIQANHSRFKITK